MRIRVLYFAAVRDLIGIDDEMVEVPPGVDDVDAFTRWLEIRHAALVGVMGAVRIARNEVFAAPRESIAEGDTLAIIPPVAGG